MPLVHPGPLAYKLAETLLALDLAHSRKAYPAPQARKDDLVRSIVDRASGRGVADGFASRVR